jgi:hypothetical protein
MIPNRFGGCQLAEMKKVVHDRLILFIETRYAECNIRWNRCVSEDKADAVPEQRRHP